MLFGKHNNAGGNFETVDKDRFQALVTTTSDVIYSLSADWSVMRELDGRGFLKDTYEPRTDWRARNIPADEQERVEAVINEAICGKKIFQLEHRVIRADGSIGWTFSRAVPILDDKGEIIEWFGTATDITDRKQAEEIIRQARETAEQQRRVYETITSNTPDLMYVFDLEYRFTYANSALLSMWGKTWENAVGKGLLENGYEPWHAEMHEREIDQVKATKKPIRGEVSFPHATLGKRIYDYILTPVLNARGEVEAVAGTTRDITEIRMAEYALRQNREELELLVEKRTKALSSSNEDLQQFAHVASHDMKEPVRKIRIFIDCLKRECAQKLNEKETDYLNRIEHSATRMSELIDGILSYASFQGHHENLEEVDLDKILHDVQIDLEIPILQKQAVIQYNNLGRINGFPILLSQLFYNLIANSIKFSKETIPPVINISAQNMQEKELQEMGINNNRTYIRILLQDNGIGFRKNEADAIFQTFTRLHSKDRFEGTGMGLALCRKIVERHGGLISARGEENKGAVFSIILPLN